METILGERTTIRETGRSIVVLPVRNHFDIYAEIVLRSIDLARC